MDADRHDVDVEAEELPEVLLMEDLATLLRCSPRTIKRRMAARVFPVPPIPGIDKRLRWSRAAVVEWLAAVGGAANALGLRRRSRR